MAAHQTVLHTSEVELHELGVIGLLVGGKARYLCKSSAFPDLARAIRSAFVHSPFPVRAG